MKISEVATRGVARSSPRIFYGWYIVLICSVVAFYAWGIGTYGQGVYIRELHSRHGWSTSLLSAAITSYFLVGAGISILAGRLIDRWGSQIVMACGAIGLALGIAALGVVTAPWQLFLAYLSMSVGWGTLTVTGISATLVPWFHRRLGLASTFAFTGASAAGIVFAPLFIFLVGRYDFAWVTSATALFVLVTLLPLLVFMHRRPEDLDLLPDGDENDIGRPRKTSSVEERRWTRSEALHAPAFWSITAAFSTALFAQGGFLIHQLPFLASRVGTSEAAALIAVTTTAGPIGRFLAGPLADKFNPRIVYIAVLLTQAIALIGFGSTSSLPLLYVWCAVFGLTFGNVLSLPALIVRREFGIASFGTVMGLVSGIAHASLAFGPSFIGLVYDYSGGYGFSFTILGAAELMAVAAMWHAYQGGRQSVVQHQSSTA